MAFSSENQTQMQPKKINQPNHKIVLISFEIGLNGIIKNMVNVISRNVCELTEIYQNYSGIVTCEISCSIFNSSF